MGAAGPLVVPADNYVAQNLQVDGQDSYWAEGQGLVRLDTYELISRSAR